MQKIQLMPTAEMQEEVDFIYNLYRKGIINVDELQKTISFYAERRAKIDLEKARIKHDKEN